MWTDREVKTTVFKRDTTVTRLPRFFSKQSKNQTSQKANNPTSLVKVIGMYDLTYDSKDLKGKGYLILK